MTVQKLSLVRAMMMGGAGALLLVYAGLAVGTGRADPMPIWMAWAGGILAWLGITGAAVVAGRARTAQAFDEGHKADTALAQRVGFWTAIWLYPLFTVLLMRGVVDWPVSFAAMGCLTAASYLICASWLDLRGRG